LSINQIPVTDKTTKCSGKPHGIFAGNMLIIIIYCIIIDPPSTTMVSYSAMSRTFFGDGESISNIF